jgi:TPR repeat protein
MINNAESIARHAIEREEYERAVNLLRDPANTGSAEAQYLLGYVLYIGGC